MPDEGDDRITVSHEPPPPSDGERYERIRLVGQGAMGEVHLAHDPVLRRKVAVKRMDPDLIRYPAMVRRFITEAQITAQLDHPSIVAVHSFDRGEGEAPSYAMRLVRGKTLAQFLDDARHMLQERRALDGAHALAARLELFLHVCDAIAYAHAHGVIHRDLKPDNVMVGPFREVQVMDWGLARLVGGPEPIEPGGPVPRRRVGQTIHGLVVGTPRYMSPEQAAGRNDELDGRSDLYALGVMLGEIASLRPVYTRAGMTLEALTLSDVETEVAIPAAAPPAPEVEQPIPPELQAILELATAPSRDHRYASVEALAEDVRRFLRDEEVLARPDTPRQRVLRWVGRNRQRAVTIGLALALLVVAVGAVGVMGALVARELERREAVLREERLGVVTAAVTEQADRMDNRLLELQGLLTGLAFTAEDALQRAPEPLPFYDPTAYATEGAGPPDLGPSAVYEVPTSVGWPDVVAAPTTDPAVAVGQMRQLAALHPALLRVQLRSHAEEALALPPEERRRLILDEGVPVVWAYVATAEGVMVGAPGTGEYPDDYDPRARPWYGIAAATRGPTWSAADADESGMGLLVTCSTALYGAGDRRLGVAAIDIPFGYLIDTLLEAPALTGRVEAFLVDASGRTMVRSSQKAEARGVTDYVPEPFPYLEALGDRRTGFAEIAGDEGRQLLVWRRLDAVDWRYVVVGDSRALLNAP